MAGDETQVIRTLADAVDPSVVGWALAHRRMRAARRRSPPTSPRATPTTAPCLHSLV